jgi:uncharacterized protein YecE (DUF72 family)
VRTFVGTSGFSYDEWKKRFYPDKLPPAQRLAYYASQLPAVEVNNTFYRLPKPELFEGWREQVPASFRFAVKCPGRITHQLKLVDTEDPLRRFVSVCATLGERQGPLLFGLPPFQRKDLPRLQAFLTLLREVAPEVKAAFEFRHASWFADDVYEALRGAQAALCIAEGEELESPFVATTGWGYLRLRRPDYDDAALTSWAERVTAQAWDEVHVYFKHEDEARGPALAAQFIPKLAK